MAAYDAYAPLLASCVFHFEFSSVILSDRMGESGASLANAASVRVDSVLAWLPVESTLSGSDRRIVQTLALEVQGSM